MYITSVFLFVIVGAFAAVSLVQSQNNQQGFISLDCGLPKDSSYTENETNINYISDANFTDTGESGQVEPRLQESYTRKLWSLRSFPDGARNCYTFNLTKGGKYLIRAWFLYGNYDEQHDAPKFDLYVGPNVWQTVEMAFDNMPVIYELIHVLSSDRLQICLVKKGIRPPFISALEVRPLKNDVYNTQRGSLIMEHATRFYFSNNEYTVRFAEDVHDRRWHPYFAGYYSVSNTTQLTTINTSLPVNPGNDSYDIPQKVLTSAATPKDTSDSISLTWTDKDATARYYIFLHFAEIEILKANETREFNISVNGGAPYGPYSPPNFTADSKTIAKDLSSKNRSYNVKLWRTERSTLPPLLNGFEAYRVIDVSQLETDQNDVDAITVIRKTYGLNRVNWKGDPCAPKEYKWNGLNCSYNDSEAPRITSLDLSSCQLKGQITPYIVNLSQLTTLDLSNNNLTGEVPVFIANMRYLSFINLSGNHLNSSVPQALLDRENHGLTLIMDCQRGACKTKSRKKNVSVPVVASVASLVVILAALGIFFLHWKKRQRDLRSTGAGSLSEPPIFSKERQFSYAEIVRMTNNFDRILGKGGFGVVYYGFLNDREQVAVKMLSESSAQGYEQFRTEVELLLRVHHRNLVSLVGYCDEDDKLALIYEYMTNGDLKEHLTSGQLGSHVLTWANRLRIVTETAQGLEYLHNGCKPLMIHRDVKTSNILLNEHFQAKLADFGLSRTFPMGSETHVSTGVVGTPGYLDPEYYTTNRLTEKSDVYSFGIVLLEIVTSQPVIDNSRERPYIAEWVKLMVYRGDITGIVDPKLIGDYAVNTVWKTIELAISCLNQPSSKRPNMSHVVMELNECLAAENVRVQGKGLVHSVAGM